MKRIKVNIALLAMAALLIFSGCGAVDLVLDQVQQLGVVEAAAPDAATSSEGSVDEELPEATMVEEAVVPEVVEAPAEVPAMAATGRLGTLTDLENVLGAVYEDVNPSVVSIQVLKRQVVTGSPQGFPFTMPEEQLQSGSGSGFVWDENGHIVTNNHVVEGADAIRVRFFDGYTVDAELVGADPDSDLAVLKIDVSADILRPVRRAQVDSIRVGQFAIAIGSPFGLENTMTVGFISALGRSLPVEAELGGPSFSIPDVIQTDAPINPGNSGGVLVNDDGEVVGVTTAIISPVQASAGIGFAVPIRIVEKVIPVLITEGRYRHPWLGFSGGSLTPDLARAMDLDEAQRGAVVITVIPDGPSERAGLRGSDDEVTIDEQVYPVGGDVIIAIDDEPIKAFDDVIAYLARTEVGQIVTLTILRDGSTRTIDVTLGERPNQETAQVQREEAAGAPGWLGISGMTLNTAIAEAMNLEADQEGVLLGDVLPESPAAEAGLRPSEESVFIGARRLTIGGDVVIGWDDASITDVSDLREQLSESSPEDQVTLTILRDGERLEVEVTLGVRP